MTCLPKFICEVYQYHTYWELPCFLSLQNKVVMNSIPVNSWSCQDIPKKHENAIQEGNKLNIEYSTVKIL